MANIKSAKKRVLQTKKRTLVNLSRLSEIKTCTKKVLVALENKNIEDAKKFLKIVESKIAKAKGKKALKANTASRKISKLAKKVASAAK